MKIVFDSKKQMTEFLAYACPGDVGLGDIDVCLGEGYGCQECWKNAGVEMEVKEND